MRTPLAAIRPDQGRKRGPQAFPPTLLLLAAMVLLSLALNPLLGKDPNQTNILAQYQPPSLEHPFGTDKAGRDVFARVIDAVKLDVGIAVGSAAASFLIGCILGAVAGYVGGWGERALMRLFDVWQAVPGLLLGLLVLSVVGRGVLPLIGVIALINIPVYARMTRAEIQPLRESQVVEATRLALVPGWRVLLLYLLPQGIASSLAYLPVQAGFAVSVAAGFGFIGLGTRPPAAEWGAMIAEGVSDLMFLDVWWTVIFPGAFLSITVLLLYQTGEWMRRHWMWTM